MALATHSSRSVPPIERSRCDQILRECGQAEFADNPGAFRDLHFADVFIPYKADQFSRNHGYLAAGFLQTQQRFLGLGDSDLHHHLRYADRERYSIVRNLHESKVDAVKIGELPSVYARKFRAKPRAPGGVDHRDQEEAARQVTNEIRCMKKCDHDHIIRFKESYTDENYFGIIMTPVSDVNLRQFIDERFESELGNVYSPESFRPDLESFFGCLLTAFCYLRQEGIRHRDIKPENILVKFPTETNMRPPRILVCDLGLAHDFIREGKDTTTSNRDGTPRYKAPELVNYERLPHKEETDVWSLGCVFVELHTAISGRTFSQLQGQLIEGKPQANWTYHETRERVLELVHEYSQQSGNLAPTANKRGSMIESMLGRRAEERKSFEELRKAMCEHETLIGECCRGSEPTRHESQYPDDLELGHQIESLTVKRINLFHRDKHQKGVDRFERWKQTRDSRECKISLYEKSAENPWDSVLHLSLDDREDPKYFWLPATFNRTSQQGNTVDLEWSDYKQETWDDPSGRPGESGRTIYKWEHSPHHPNHALCIDFEGAEEARNFMRKILFYFPNQGPLLQANMGSNNYVIVQRQEWAFERPGEMYRGQCILNYVSTASEPSAIRRIESPRQLQRYFVPHELDFEFVESSQTSNGRLQLNISKLLQPLYLSNHPQEKTRKPPQDVEAAVPGLTLASKVNVLHQWETSTPGLKSVHAFRNVIKLMSSWQLIWCESFERLTKLTFVACFPRKREYASAGAATVWQHGSASKGKRLALRCSRHSSRGMTWIVLEGISNVSAGINGITIDCMYHTLGNLINLERLQASGAASKPPIRESTTFQIVLNSKIASDLAKLLDDHT